MMTPPPPPVRFDLVDLVTRTYRILYAERLYLIRLAAFPITVMFLNSLLVTLIFPDISLLRRGLLLIPAMMAEAWLVCQFMRTLLTRERWPMRLPAGFSGTIPPQLLDRASGLISGMIFYLLVTLLINGLAGVIGTMFLPLETVKNTTADPTQGPYALIITGLLGIILFNYRLMWMYIPLVINLPIRHYLAVTRGGLINFHLVGLWMATALPIMMLGMLILQPLTQVTNDDSPVSFIFFLLFYFLNVVIQTLLSLATSSVMAVALAPLLFPNKKTPSTHTNHV